MKWVEHIREIGRLRERPGSLAVAAVVGLLAVSILAGSIELALYQRVGQITNEALRYDVALEDQADDVRIAVYTLELQHRNLALSGPSQGRLDSIEGAYKNLQNEIDELDRLGVRSQEVAQPDRLREQAKAYYTDFRPKIGLQGSDLEAFTRASDRGLVRLDELDREARRIDELGEKNEAEAIRGVERVARTASLVLIVVVGGLIALGAVMAYAAVRMIREIRNLYAREQRAREDLAQALRTKSEFLADASHELRTPLTVLRGRAEIGAQLEDDPSRRETFEEMARESSHMSRMIDDLLFLARSDSESAPLEREALAVPGFVAGATRRAEILAEERGARLETELETEGEIYADRERLEQALLILVDNATKYSLPGKPITLSAFNAPGELIIRVEDRGPGIPEEELPWIFERFYRVDKSRERKRGGTGLGLSIAKLIVEAHGGSISADSTPGEGTRMSLRLPLRDGLAPESDSPGRASEVGEDT